MRVEGAGGGRGARNSDARGHRLWSIDKSSSSCDTSKVDTEWDDEVAAGWGPSMDVIDVPLSAPIGFVHFKGNNAVPDTDKIETASDQIDLFPTGDGVALTELLRGLWYFVSTARKMDISDLEDLAVRCGVLRYTTALVDSRQRGVRAGDSVLTPTDLGRRLMVENESVVITDEVFDGR